MPGTAPGTARGQGAGHTQEAGPAQGLVTAGLGLGHIPGQDQETGGQGPGQTLGHGVETEIQEIRMVTKRTERSFVLTYLMFYCVLLLLE